MGREVNDAMLSRQTKLWSEERTPCGVLVAAFCRNELSLSRIARVKKRGKVREGGTPSPARYKRALPRPALTAQPEPLSNCFASVL